jgi:predicted GNAT superfamily acetyltransferase
MTNRLLYYSDLERLHTAHQENVSRIWQEAERKIYDTYLEKGYLSIWARAKARQDVLILRSLPSNPDSMIIPPDQTKQGDLD